MNKQRKGFTLIELLVVIAIIALLSTLAVVALNNAREKSRDAKRVSDVKQIQTALELYYAEVGEYPTEATAVNLGEAGQTTLSSDGDFSDTASGNTYMGQVPTPPASALDDVYAYTSADGSTYSIDFELEGPTGSLQDTGDNGTDITCEANPSGVTCL